MSFVPRSRVVGVAIRKLDSLPTGTLISTTELARALNVQPAWVRQIVAMDVFDGRTFLAGTRQRVFGGRRTITKLKKRLESI